MSKNTGLPSRRVVRAVLKDVNALRAKCGLPPVVALLKGQRSYPTGCPVARALAWGHNVPVNANKEYLRIWTVMDRASSPTGRFVADFDAGKYPGLVLP